MINADDARPGFNVFYQQRHMKSPEYGSIVSPSGDGRHVLVRFTFDTTAKPCRVEDLFWPPDFCARDGANPPGQIFDTHYRRHNP